MLKLPPHSEKDCPCYEGDVSVLHQLNHVATHTENGGTAKERPMLIVMGGVQRGVYGAGALRALAEAGFSKSFDSVLGISTGAPSAAYFLTEQTEHANMYYQECVHKDVYNFFRLFRGRPIINTDYLAQLFRGEVNPARRLLVERIQSLKTRFYTPLTEYQTATSKLVDVTRADDPVMMLQAAISLPFFSHSIIIDGDRYVDGGATDVFPLSEMLKRHQPTSILVIANSGKTWEYPWTYRLGRALSRLFLPTALSKRMDEAFVSHRTLFKSLRCSGIPYLILWADPEVKAFTTNQAKLKAAFERSYTYTSDLIKQTLRR